MKKLLFIFLGLAIHANAQVLITGETMGKGKLAAFVNSNVLVISDFTTANFSSTQLWYGLTNRADVFAGISETVLLGQKQTAIAVGANVNLLKHNGFAVSWLNALSTPFNRRSDASLALWFTAVVVSKNLQICKFSFTPYGGYSLTIPLSDPAVNLFTTTKPVHNVPVGIMIPRGKWSVFAEYNFGKEQQIIGLGLAYTF